MTTAYIFDVDGTLTPSRGLMDVDFKRWFLDFQSRHDVYLASGSDYPKTLEQVGEDVCLASKMIFSCCGNEVRMGHDVLHKMHWEGTPDLIEALEEELRNASFNLRTGQHIEKRTGLINFSVVGRGATKDQRKLYVEYDSTRFERRSIASRLKKRFNEIDFAIAGETGIDIYPLGCDKGQVLKWIDADHTIFFGDATYPRGNDRALALKCDQYHAVEGWQHTWNLLIEIDKHTK